MSADEGGWTPCFYRAEPASMALRIPPRFRKSSSREGLRRYWLTPRRAASTWSFFASDEVRITIGTRLHRALRRNRARTSRPDLLGRLRSTMIKSGQSTDSASSSSMSRIAFSPSPATISSPSMLCSSRALRTKFASAGLSSTRRIKLAFWPEAASLDVFEWDCKVKCRTPAGLGLHPDSTAGPLHNPPANGKAHARSGIFGDAVKTFE